LESSTLLDFLDSWERLGTTGKTAFRRTLVSGYMSTKNFHSMTLDNTIDTIIALQNVLEDKELREYLEYVKTNIQST
jgi:hypothetical protein